MNKVIVNGILLAENDPALLVSNRAFRYGDGIFETMLMKNGSIAHLDLHMNRLQKSLSLLGYNTHAGFAERFPVAVRELAEINQCISLARVRFTVYPGNGTLGGATGTMDSVMECTVLSPDITGFNTDGIVLGVFPHARKSTDRYSNLKSASALIYAEAARFAVANSFDECLVMNTDGNIADSTIANIFIIKAGQLITPSLGEGCVDGVMRRFLLESMKNEGYEIRETALTAADIEAADECFLTNAIRGIRWVRTFGKKTFENRTSRELYGKFIGQG